MIKRAIMFATAFFSAACATSLSRETIRNHPGLKIETLEPRVVETSSPVRPGWILKPDRGAVSYVAFTGQSFAPTLDAAKAQAMKDLLSAVSSYVSVEVASEFEAFQSERTSGATTQSETEIRSRVRSQSSAAVQGVKADESYWEKVQASPLLPDNVSYRFFAYARVPKAEITRARLEKQLERQKKSGRKMLVVLPFRPALASPDLAVLADAFAEELSRKLSGVPALYVSDPGLVRGLLTADRLASEADALETVREALLPDFVIGGNYQLFEKRLRVTYTIYGAPDAGVLATETVERNYGELFQLEDQLIQGIEKHLSTRGARTENDEAPPPPADSARTTQALEAYYEAYALFRAGKNEPAIAAVGRAIELEPTWGRAYLRLGRIFDRLGRYGYLTPQLEGAGGNQPLISLCTPWNKVSNLDPWTFLSAPETISVAAETKSTPAGEDVDAVLSAVQYVRQGGFLPDPQVPARPVSAIGAYWHAFRLARQAKDLRLESEVLLALADLAQRVDRLAYADTFYRSVLADAQELADLNLESLALYGIGRVLRDRSELRQAFEILKQALDKRMLMMEKPYLLEILNELGGLSVGLAQYSLARAFYEKALKIAEDLDDDYFRAVLGNNLGVLEMTAGRTARAEEYFQRAWLFLTDLDEASGRIASGLNISALGALRGDRERAAAYLREVKRIVETTGQEGKLAELHHHEGAQSLVSGGGIEAMRSLLRSWALYRRLGRPIDQLRLRNAVLAAEVYGLAAEMNPQVEVEREVWPIVCLQDKAHALLIEGWGADDSTTAAMINARYDDYSYYGRWARYRYAEAEAQQVQPRYYQLLAADSPTHLWSILNAEIMARLR